MSNSRYANDFPAAASTIYPDAHWTDTVVRKGHVDYCAEHGHAAMLELPGMCARCGVVFRPAHRAPLTRTSTPDDVFDALRAGDPKGAVITALLSDDGAGLGSRGTHGAHAAMIAESQLTRELDALAAFLPEFNREALFYAWESQCDPASWTPAS